MMMMMMMMMMLLLFNNLIKSEPVRFAYSKQMHAETDFIT